MSEAGTWDRTRIPESWHLPRVLTQMREKSQRGESVPYTGRGEAGEELVQGTLGEARSLELPHNCLCCNVIEQIF